MKNKKIYIASDHAGFAVKQEILEKLIEKGFHVMDCGPTNSDRVDYPDFANLVCLTLKNEVSSVGILICGSGQGMAMRANKYSHIRAALCWNTESAKLSRNHNDANVLCLGARLLEKPLLFSILDVFLKEEFEGERHQARVLKISKVIS